MDMFKIMGLIAPVKEMLEKIQSHKRYDDNANGKTLIELTLDDKSIVSILIKFNPTSESQKSIIKTINELIKENA